MRVRVRVRSRSRVRVRGEGEGEGEGQNFVGAGGVWLLRWVRVVIAFVVVVVVVIIVDDDVVDDVVGSGGGSGGGDEFEWYCFVLHLSVTLGSTICPSSPPFEVAEGVGGGVSSCTIPPVSVALLLPRRHIMES